MQTEPIAAFQIEDQDTILVGEVMYVVKGEPQDDGDFILFDTIDEDGETTQLPFGAFDTVLLVTVFDDELTWEDVLVED